MTWKKIIFLISKRQGEVNGEQPQHCQEGNREEEDKGGRD